MLNRKTSPASRLLLTTAAAGLTLLGGEATAQPASKAKTGPTAGNASAMGVMPSGEAPAWAPGIDPQMLAVLEEFSSFEPPVYPELTPFQVRMAVLPVDAVQSLLLKTGFPATEPKVDTSHKVLPVGPEEGLLARIYTPLGADAREPLPVIVYFHGGGWVIADLDAYAGGAKGLAVETGAIVVSVAYRMAPEHTYPTAHEDAYAAFAYVAGNAASMGGDPRKVAIAGESAGGNLAVAVPLMAKERGGPMPSHIVSVYPIADGDTESASYDEYAEAAPLNRPFMAWFFNEYTPDWKTASKSDFQYVNLTSADLSGLPPVTIINAQIDPLEAEGGELEEALREAGVTVTRKVYPGVTHEFFGMTPVLEQAGAAQKHAADELKKTFGTN